MENIPFLSKLSTFSVFIPLLLALVTIRFHHREVKFLAYLVYTSFLVEICMVYLGYQKVNNLPLLNILTMAEFTLLSLMYYHLFREPRLKRFIKISIHVFVAFTFLYATFIKGWYEYSDVPRALESLMLVAFSLIYFRKLLTDLNVFYIEKEPAFWVSTAVLFYFSGSLFMYIFSSYLALQYIDVMKQVWHIHSMLMIIYNLLLAVGIWYSRQKFSRAIS
ncbi:hypothetical protein AB9P05_08315 [Roseivirga sp. BDSF3-8]|uniref:hypothetical protein n=1 Tax=Roseivirga sp. BDSF3-8 TaxID=3241598 RepID=UPI003531CEA3